MSDLNYIEAHELAKLLTEKSVADRLNGEDATAQRIVIMDVRDADEFEEGHVKGATHIPSNDWHDPEILENIMQQYSQTDSKTTFVFHCAKSQVRGPTCARIFQNRLQQSVNLDNATEGQAAQPEV